MWSLLKKNNFLISISLLLVFCSCAERPNKLQKEFAKYAEKGKPIERTCSGNNYNRYVVYLPNSYSLNERFPILFCFDPHADANLAISHFKNYAEKNNLIVVASATVQNGLSAEEIALYLYQLYKDVQSKIWIDTTHIFAAGFSGGARVAAHFATQIAPVAGLISCSAGYYPGEKCIPAILIAGKYDMNYLETKVADSKLGDCKHCFLTFEGPHQWPPSSILYRALDMLMVWNHYSSKFNSNKFENDRQNILNKLNQTTNDSIWSLVEELRIFIATYEEFPETEIIRKKYDSIVGLEVMKKYVDNLILAENFEFEQQKQIYSALGNRPLEWWKKRIADWKNGITHERNIEMVATYKRLLAYLSLLAYSYANSAINQGNWPTVEYILPIYGLADPTNPDYHYFMACWYAHRQQISLALKELEIAFAGGINRSKAIEDPNLRLLKPYLLN
ncbi:MAG: hypothetical protein N2662_08130 [Bacteroidales bacterium]|nr:hypothetical protein [Bacteroidales bacterium]